MRFIDARQVSRDEGGGRNRDPSRRFFALGPEDEGGLFELAGQAFGRCARPPMKVGIHAGKRKYGERECHRLGMASHEKVQECGALSGTRSSGPARCPGRARATGSRGSRRCRWSHKPGAVPRPRSRAERIGSDETLDALERNFPSHGGVTTVLRPRGSTLHIRARGLEPRGGRRADRGFPLPPSPGAHGTRHLRTGPPSRPSSRTGERAPCPRRARCSASGRGRYEGWEAVFVPRG